MVAVLDQNELKVEVVGSFLLATAAKNVGYIWENNVFFKGGNHENELNGIG